MSGRELSIGRNAREGKRRGELPGGEVSSHRLKALLRDNTCQPHERMFIKVFILKTT